MSSLLTGLAGKVVLITGGSSRLGRYTALEFAKNGCKIVIAGRKHGNSLERTQNTCISEGKLNKSNILKVVADVEQVDDCRKLVEETIATFGQLDVLVNSTGILTGGGIEHLSLEDYEKQMNINTRSVFITTQTAVPHLKKTKGSIVNVSSVTGLRAVEGELSYCISKGAIDQLTKSVALELGKFGIRCNAVNPGITITGFDKSTSKSGESNDKDIFMENAKSSYPLGRIGEADEIAKCIVFLASNELSGFLTGVILPVDGGRSIMYPR